jgi:thiol-disulfide isomerase/thioredoxin
MKRILGATGATLVIACLLLACEDDKQQFRIDGKIAGGAGKTLYLENIGVAKIVTVDSLRLTADDFKFCRQRPAFPDFYRLRLGRQVINLAIDSTETIHVETEAASFGKGYTLAGDVFQSQKIKELTLLQNTAATHYKALQEQYQAGGLSANRYAVRVDSVVNAYKTAAKDYLFPDLLALTAYFALFQQIDKLFIFDIYDKDDNKLFGAAANLWNTLYPESPRAAQLKKFYLESRAIIRGEQQPLPITEAKTLFDVALLSLDNKPLRLSEIGDEKWTLIDFTAYSGAHSPAHNLQLAELYDRYRSKGLEIYQIALESDVHFWKNAAINLPWHCVRDPEAGYSAIAQRFNVTRIPTSFLRNKKGDIVARVEDYSTLNKTVAEWIR